MVAVGAAEKLLLLSCLLCAITASPIQERKDWQIARASRIHRIKTAMRTSQEQPSIWSNKRTFPNPNSPVANFDSRQQQQVSSVSKQEQTDRQKEQKISPDVRTGVENVPSEHVKLDSQIPHQTTEPFRTRGSHSHLPAVSNFGERIHNKPETKNSRCRVKGGCSSVNVRPSGVASTPGVSSSSDSVHDHTESKQNTDASYNQQQQFAVPIVPEAPQVLDNAQNVDVTSHNNQGFPDYEGLVSPQDFPRITETLNPFQSDDQQYTQNFPSPTETQIPFQSDGQQHTQDFPRVPDVQVPFQQDDQQYTQNFPRPTETQIPFQVDGQQHTQDFPRVTETQVPFQQDDQQYTQEISRATDAQVPLHTNDQQHTQDLPRVIDSNVPFQSDDQQYTQDFPKVTDTQVTFQSEDKQHTQDFLRVTDSEAPFQADDQQHPNDENRGNVFDQRPIQDNIDYQMQFVPQTGDVGVPTVQGNSHEQTTGHSSSSSNFPKEQGIQKLDSDYQGQNVHSSSQLDQNSNSNIFIPKSNEHFEGQQHTSGHTSVSDVGDHQSSDDGQYHHVGNYIDWLKYSVPGNPGEDYPIFYQVPQTSFDCRQQQFSAGIYGDMEASCQVFHVCKENGGQDSFLCPNGTVFNQQYFVCDWWYNFRCSDTPSFYNLNADLYWDWENFTPSQVLNAPVSNVDGAHTSFQSGSQDRFDGVSGPSRQDTAFNNGVVKSTIAIDNSAIAGKSPVAHEQRPEEHAFTEKKSSFGGDENSFMRKDQEHKQPVQDHFATSFSPDFSGVTRVQSATVSPISDNNSANIPTSSFFTANNNRKTTNTVTSVASDTGKNRQSGDNPGTRYPGQTAYGQHDFQSRDQNKPTTVSEGKPSDVSTTENKLFTQGPTSFEGNAYIGDNAQRQISHGGDVSQGTQFDISHQTTVSEEQTGGNHSPQEVQQEYLTDFFGGTTSPTFNPVLKDGVQSEHRNSFSGKEQIQGQSVFSNNKNENADFQGVQQELGTTSFGSQQNTFATRDENRYQQKDDKDFHSGRPALDQQNVLRDDISQNIPNEVHTNSNQGTHRNSVVQQQHISASFDGNSEKFFPNQQSDNFGSQNEFTVPQDIRTTPSLDNVKDNFENTASRRDQAHVSQNEPQQHVTTSFAVNNQDVRSTEVTDKKSFTNSPFNVNEGSRTTNSLPVGNFNQNIGQEHSSFSNNGDSRRNMEDFYNNQANRQTVPVDFHTNNPEVDAGNSNSDAFKNVQQEFVPAFDDVKVNVPNSDEQIDFNQQHSTSFQPQNQNAFVDGNTFQDQNLRGNPAVQQEHTSVPFSGSNLDSFDSNRDRNEQQIFTNTNQGNTLITDNQNYDNSQKRPNTFGSDVGVSKPYKQENPKLQQENVIFPFDGNAGHSFIPGDNRQNNVFITNLPEQQINPVSSDEQFPKNFQNNIYPNDKQDRRPIDVEQKETPEAFRGDRPSSVEPMENYHRQEDQQNRNNKDQGLPRGVNTENNHEIRQEYISSFDGPQINAFSSPENSGDRTVQDRYANSQHGFRQNFNQQNRFTPNFNENQQAFGAPQNVKQEHVPISFDNNQQNLGQNAFGQNENQRVVHQQHQGNFQLNSFDRGSHAANQNANEAFQMRLNNFQPVNIHMMNRGGLRNGNYQQQMLSFRPYGQNDQNTVRFPVENGVAFRVDQQNDAAPAYSGGNGPSNQNFFVTNGHQMREEFSQQPPDQHFSNEQPRNNIQNGRQYGTEAQFTNNPVSTDRFKEDTRNEDFNQGHPSESDSEDVNSRIKGYSSNNARSLDFSGNNNAGQFPTISINADDTVRYNQQAPESPSSMSYNGWKPVVKY